MDELIGFGCKGTRFFFDLKKINNLAFAKAFFTLLQTKLVSDPPEAKQMKDAASKIFWDWERGALVIKKTRASEITGIKAGRFKTIPFVVTSRRLMIRIL